MLCVNPELLFLLCLQVKPLPAIKEGNKKFWVESKMAPRSNPMAVSRLVPATPASLPMTEVAPQPTPVERKGKNGAAMMPRLFDVSCDEILCSADSFCVNDYTWGGSRCHCNLGKGGESCSEGRPLGDGVGNMVVGWPYWEPEGSFASTRGSFKSFF